MILLILEIKRFYLLYIKEIQKTQQTSSFTFNMDYIMKKITIVTPIFSKQRYKKGISYSRKSNYNKKKHTERVKKGGKTVSSQPIWSPKQTKEGERER